MRGAGIRVVVTDANVLINLIHVSRLRLLATIPDHEFIVPEHVQEELKIPHQRAILEAAIAEGWLTMATITDLAMISVFIELIGVMGRGEAACLAIAAKEGWYIASDEKRSFSARPRLAWVPIVSSVQRISMCCRSAPDSSPSKPPTPIS